MKTDTPDCIRDLLLHDIRTPLAIVSGCAQLLRRRAAMRRLHVRDVLRYVESIEAAAKRAEQVLDELSRLAGPDDRLPPRCGTVDLVALVVRTSTQTRALGRPRITVLSSVKELVGAWDSDRLQHVLTNLFDNALKYSPDGRDVLVTVQRGDDQAVLTVADQGVGIPPAELCQVFEPGYRGSNVAGMFPGTGVGLAGVHQIVAEHRGTITVESQLEVGTTITVRLPIV